MNATENCPTCNQNLNDHDNQQIAECVKKQLEEFEKVGDFNHG